jgi:hypothetical protein
VTSSATSLGRFFTFGLVHDHHGIMMVRREQQEAKLRREKAARPA